MILLYTIYALIAIFIAWIWVDYYRLIDIYGRSNLPYFMITFLLGAGTTYLVVQSNTYIFNYSGWNLNNSGLNDFLYFTIRVGMLEEIAKMLPFVLVWAMFPRKFGSPIDFVSFICVSALGFSAAENAIYFMNFGPGIINGRAILSTVGHMFDTALIAYGIILFRYGKAKYGFLTVVLFFLLASVSHGLYDFLLSFDALGGFGILLTIGYFLVTISWFATILNNAMNNSNNFTYKKVINSSMVSRRILIYYGIVFALQFLLVFLTEGAINAVGVLVTSFIMTGLIIFIASVRLSRFKLIQNRWDTFKIELPFSIVSKDQFAEGYLPLPFGGYYLKVKGESFNEAGISPYYHEFFYLNPTNPSTSKIKNRKLAYIESKVFLKGDKAYYKARLYKSDANSVFAYILLRPKTTRPTMYDNQHQVVAILKHDKAYDEANNRTTTKKFRFVEWAFITNP